MAVNGGSFRRLALAVPAAAVTGAAAIATMVLLGDAVHANRTRDLSDPLVFLPPVWLCGAMSALVLWRVVRNDPPTRFTTEGLLRAGLARSVASFAVLVAGAILLFQQPQIDQLSSNASLLAGLIFSLTSMAAWLAVFWAIDRSSPHGVWTTLCSTSIVAPGLIAGFALPASMIGPPTPRLAATVILSVPIQVFVCIIIGGIGIALSFVMRRAHKRST